MNLFVLGKYYYIIIIRKGKILRIKEGNFVLKEDSKALCQIDLYSTT